MEFVVYDLRSPKTLMDKLLVWCLHGAWSRRDFNDTHRSAPQSTCGLLVLVSFSLLMTALISTAMAFLGYSVLGRMFAEGLHEEALALIVIFTIPAVLTAARQGSPWAVVICEGISWVFDSFLGALVWMAHSVGKILPRRNASPKKEKKNGLDTMFGALEDFINRRCRPLRVVCSQDDGKDIILRTFDEWNVSVIRHFSQEFYRICEAYKADHNQQNPVIWMSRSFAVNFLDELIARGYGEMRAVHQNRLLLRYRGESLSEIVERTKTNVYPDGTLLDGLPIHILSPSRDLFGCRSVLVANHPSISDDHPIVMLKLRNGNYQVVPLDLYAPPQDLSALHY